jgi:hypothetical protein
MIGMDKITLGLAVVQASAAAVQEGVFISM